MPYFVDREEFEALAGEWQQALSQCTTDSIFLTPLWQQVWWQELGTGELQLLRVRQDDRLLGIAPLVRDDSCWSFLGGASLFDYHDFITLRGAEVSFFQALLDYLEGERWQTLDLFSLPEGSSTLEVLPALARERGYAVELEEEDVTPGVALPGGWEEYLAGLGKKDRHELRRKLRRLEEAGAYHTTVVQDAHELPEAMDEFLTMMRTSRVDKQEFLTPERERFFRSMGRELSQAEYLQLYFLQVNGSRVATAMCFDYRGSRFLYNSGYDLAYSSLSVSLLLNALCLKDAIGKGMGYFDFLRGSEEYKYHLGGKDMHLMHLVIRRPSLPQPEGASGLA